VCYLFVVVVGDEVRHA